MSLAGKRDDVRRMLMETALDPHLEVERFAGAVMQHSLSSMALEPEKWKPTDLALVLDSVANLFAAASSDAKQDEVKALLFAELRSFLTGDEPPKGGTT